MAKRNECVAYLTHNSHEIEGSGCSCNYYVYKGMGIKCFTDEEDASRAYKMQRRLYKHGMAPMVLSRLRSYSKNWDCGSYKVFFFLTEIAEVYMHTVKMDFDYDEDAMFDDVQYIEVREKLKSLGLTDWDAHDENYGYIDAKLVVIDTGSIS